MKANHLFLFTNDLRVDDNPALLNAIKSCDTLVCVYCLDPILFSPGHYSHQPIAAPRWQFLKESITALASALSQLGQQLLIHFESPKDTIPKMITEYDITAVYRSLQVGWNEQAYWQTLKRSYPYITFEEYASNTLWSLNELPFSLEDLPDIFSQFRKQVEKRTILTPYDRPAQLPKTPLHKREWSSHLPNVQNSPSQFKGGETAGYLHLHQYFASSAPSIYKETRNALDQWEHSTKFSPWLAQGCISVKRIYETLRTYEKVKGANDSTYWIFFELLWREYFQWYALKHGAKLFHFKGIKSRKPLTSFYPQRFKSWCEGTTAFPLVNACMKQLRATGYMSNRGRQIAASCLINELEIDWRYGADWFEQHLIDYDAASNWGNWQYLAGVGADPRGLRRFNIDKQTQTYDPQLVFIKRWQGNTHMLPTHRVDAADWPIE
ncbi:DASH family cryptochrome [Nitrincola nitratireducens]|uniref:Cryptochrome DASH n=1 Tax=Nitrincola nitratireducens TaxID=1229521 RepID=W9V7Z9_9GAMM|nr:DASH family cryptochrome [Nitrincola nitratireducens]EXJ13006.1 Cryptochrome DASH [Nitrincola nitratireducens]